MRLQSVSMSSIRRFKAAEKRLAEIQVLKKHIVNYRKTKDTYVAYRKSGYSSRFFEEHREELTLHKAAKEAFDQLNTNRLPTIRELNEEYSGALTQKKADYAEYRKAKKEMRESVTARKNVEIFYMESNLGDENDMLRNRVKYYEHNN
jgi:predicted restriction endonuclease